MKYISFVVPSYNSEKYLNKCVDSLLYGDEDVEIIIVNDGSKDRTLEIALDYQTKYPNIVKVIDKENGGHGSGLNAGIMNATGLYFKCVDSDDWVDKSAYKEVLDVIKKNHEENKDPDLYLTNYVFERLDCNKQFVHKNTDAFKPNQMLHWNDVKGLKIAEYVVMHSMIYKLDVLKQSKVKLPEHTFYVDNIFTYVPLKYVKTLYYIDSDFYRYYVGREGQSVTYENMTKNYNMQIKVMKELSLAYTYDEIKALPRGQRKFMMHDLIIKSYLTLFYVMAGYDKTRKEAYNAYFKEFKEKNKSLYYKLRYRTYLLFPFTLIMPLRRFVVMLGYKKVVKKTSWQ